MEALQPNFILPACFDPGILLPASLAKRLDDARYFINTILRKLVRQQADATGYVRLRAANLRKVMHFRDYSKVVDALLSAGTVQRTSYQVRNYPFGYRLDTAYLHEPHKRIRVKDERLLARLMKFIQKCKEDGLKEMLPVHQELWQRQKRLDIDGSLARSIIADLPAESNPFDVQNILVADIEQRQFRLSVGNYGRVSNSITNLKREVREALRVDGERLVGVDIACCQPSLLALLMQRLIPPTEGKNCTSYNASLPPPVGLPSLSRLGLSSSLVSRLSGCLDCPSVSKFADRCCRGSLFDFLLRLFEERGIETTRDRIKLTFLADILAKRKANRHGAEYPSEMESIFREEFPGVWQFIRIVNGHGWNHERLIRILQRLESWLVIENVCQRFMTDNPSEFVITLHDAIYVCPGAVERATAAFEGVFEALEFHMTLKIEKG